MHTHTHTLKDAHTRTHALTLVRTHACTRTHMHTHTRTQMHAHTHIWNSLPLLCGWAACADEGNYDHHYHGNGSHGNHNDDQQVTVLLRGDAAVWRTHLTNRRLWNQSTTSIKSHWRVVLKLIYVTWNCDPSVTCVQSEDLTSGASVLHISHMILTSRSEVWYYFSNRLHSWFSPAGWDEMTYSQFFCVFDHFFDTLDLCGVQCLLQ